MKIRGIYRVNAKKQFLKLVYMILALHPEWVRDVVKAINVVIKDVWTEEKGT